MNDQSLYVGEEIEARYHKKREVIKTPVCPDYFEWKNQTFLIKQLLSEWKDFTRKGRFNRNMSPGHKKRAYLSGSWGVGRFFFRVKTDSGRVFDIYYDRGPGKGSDRKGYWILFKEWIK